MYLYMDYYHKYIKYKTKYINLKYNSLTRDLCQNGGNNIIFSDEKAIKLNENDKYKCPEEMPYFCTLKSKSVGLCKSKIQDCDKIKVEGVIPIINKQNETEDHGLKHGYTKGNLNKRCFKLSLDYEKNNNTNNEINDEFKIMTLNVMGIIREGNDNEEYKYKLDIIKKRMNKVVEEILNEEPDIICFQEMSNETYNVLFNGLKEEYKYIYEEDFNFDQDKINSRNRDIEVCFFSKYQANKVKIYGLSGNLSYKCSLGILEFSNLVIYNCYLQAGSKYSVGQEDYQYHYLRCRMDQLAVIKKMIKTNLVKNVIVTGDLNFDLGGDLNDWPELNKIKYLKDAWKVLNKNDKGYTENTDINHMRWNMKFKEKKLRYDALLYRGKLKPIKTKLVCTNEIQLNKKESELFSKYFMEKNADEKLIKYSDYEKKLLSIFPSDHFGVLGMFKIKRI